jgi:phosphoribulokinase
VFEELDRREADSETFIRPQQRWADIVVSFKPGDLGDQEHLDAELRLRDGLGHPDLAPWIDGERGLHMAERENERVVWISGAIDPDYAEEVEAAVWDRMHFASHLRSERLGEFTVGTELHRSQSLAIVQVLVLYHLVTGHATVSLGGDGPRLAQVAAG